MLAMKTVLILEDDTMLADEWCDVLRALGYRVVHVQTASEALDVLQRSAIDLVIADIFIQVEGELAPDGGITLLGRRSEDRLAGKRTVPVVAVTGAPSTGPYATSVLDLARSMGAAEALQKPVPPERLAACVAALVGA
jgi:CheY-like chemotaxis protein